jgi:uncharacterized alkaline shock family protein YloU
MNQQPVNQQVSSRTVRYNTEVAAASAAADAARATPGVVRLQPGLWGLVQQLSREMWERATGTRYPDIAGVEATLDADGTAVHLDISMVLHSGHNATAVSAAVQESARIAVTALTGLAVTTVTTHITDIDLAPLLA